MQIHWGDMVHTPATELEPDLSDLTHTIFAGGTPSYTPETTGFGMFMLSTATCYSDPSRTSFGTRITHHIACFHAKWDHSFDQFGDPSCSFMS